MHGYDDVVSYMDDPVCLIQEEIVSIPPGCNPPALLLVRELDEGTLPWSIARRYLDVPQTTTVVFPALEIPPQITNEAVTCRLDALYQNFRPQCFPETAKTARVKWSKNPSRLATAVSKTMGEDLQQSGVFFRGLSLRALAFSFSTFLPMIYTGNYDNEFGPGIYTTEDFEVACRFAGPTGAIMAFKNIDERELDIWHLAGQHWNRFVSFWLDIGVNDLGVPAEYKTADVVCGPTSADQREARQKKRYPTQSEDSQKVFISYEAYQRLMASLIVIVYLRR